MYAIIFLARTLFVTQYKMTQLLSCESGMEKKYMTDNTGDPLKDQKESLTMKKLYSVPLR